MRQQFSMCTGIQWYAARGQADKGRSEALTALLPNPRMTRLLPPPLFRGPTMRTTWTFHSAGQLVFGRDSAQQVGDIAGRLGIKRLLLVTDAILMGAGLVDRILPSLSEAGVHVEVFTGGEPEPSLRAAHAAIGAGRSFRPDGVLGLGGGSNL